MRGDAEAHQMVAPGTLAGVLELMAEQPGQWTPIAGGTELMVAHAAGRLPPAKLVSLWGIADLRFIQMAAPIIRMTAAIPSPYNQAFPEVLEELPAAGDVWFACDASPLPETWNFTS